MNIVERERTLPVVQDRVKWLKYQLDTEFRRFVGRQHGDRELQNFPNFTPDGQDNSPVNPDWVEAVKPLNRRISSTLPGPLRYNPDTKSWEAVDPDSAVGRIASIQNSIRKEMAEGSLSEPGRKQLERKIRKELVDIFNGYAGLRFNNQRDVVNGSDFRGVNVNFMAASSLYNWRAELVAARMQSVELTLFNRWEEADKKIQTPTMADWFIRELFRQPVAAAHDTKLADAAKIFRTLLNLEHGKGYVVIADIFYGGDMLKTFINLSAVAKMTGGKLPEGWQQFHGTTAELKVQRDWLITNPSATVDDFANRFSITRRDKASLNLAALRNMESTSAFETSTDTVSE